VKVADKDPAGMVTVGGMDAIAEAPLLIFRLTVVSVGIAKRMATVPVTLAPPIAGLATNVMLIGPLGVAVKEAALDTPLAVALKVMVVLLGTNVVPMLQLAVELPAGTTTLAGTEVTADAPAVTAIVTGVSMGATPVRVTLPVFEDPPVMDDEV
jgi:hypothetical protein